MQKLTNERKKILRNWVFKIGYEKALASLHKEHDDIFKTLGEEGKEYDQNKTNRLEELVHAIQYVEFLQKTGAHQLNIFRN